MKRLHLSAVALFFAAVMPTLRGAELDTRVPSDALVYVQWAGAQSQQAAYNESNLKGIIDATGIPAWLGENLPQWISSATEGDEAAAKNLAEMQKDLLIIWQHPTALYVGAFGDMAAGPHIAILCDAGTDAQPLVDSLNTLIPKNASAHPQIANDNGVVIVTFGASKPLDFVAGANSLANHSTYQKTFKALAGAPAAPAVKMYIDFPPLMKNSQQAINSVLSDDRMKLMFPAVVETLGLNALGQLGYSGGFAQKNWDEVGFLSLNGPRKGLFALADNKNITNDDLAIVPKDAISFSIGHLNWSGLVALTRDTLTTIDNVNQTPKPDGIANTFEHYLQQANAAVGLDLEKDVIDTLDSQMTLYRFAPDNGALSMAFIQKLKNPAALTKSLETLEGFVNERGGGQIRVAKIDAGDNIEVSGIQLPQGNVAWTVRGNYLYISSDAAIGPAILQIEKKNPSVLTNPDFVAARAALGDHLPIALNYANPAKIYPEVYSTAQMLLPLLALQGINVPSDLLPLPETAAPFLTPGASMSWSGADGIHFASHTAFPGAAMLAGQTVPGTSQAKTLNPKPAR